MYHGIINVYKEAGYTSHDVVARLRGICKQKKIGQEPLIRMRWGFFLYVWGMVQSFAIFWQIEPKSILRFCGWGLLQIHRICQEWF